VQSSSFELRKSVLTQRRKDAKAQTGEGAAFSPWSEAPRWKPGASLRRTAPRWPADAQAWKNR
ncbi:MAG: hypothetical protein C5B50_23275, partial [Verrucomicrobia bacterium]